MAKSKKSKRPTGLAISRNGMVFTFKWKKGDTYKDGQQLQYKIGTGKKPGWKDLSIADTAASKAVSLSASSYYPASGKRTLRYISFRVRGNHDKKKNDNFGWSEWSDKTFDVIIPRRPSSAVFELSEDYSNVGTFTWEVAVSDDDTHIFTDTEYQSLITEGGETDGSRLSWNSSQSGWLSGTAAASGTRSVTEDTAVIAVGSHTRWMRVRSRGPQGNSDWVYAKHTYSAPQTALIISADAAVNNQDGLDITVTWIVPSDSRTPIDKTAVQWAVVTPSAGLLCPDDAGWTDADTSRDTSGTDMARFTIDQLVGEDKCLFVRVNTLHDKVLIYGKAKMVTAGVIKAPSITSVETDTATSKAVVTAANNSEIPDSILAVLFRAASDPSQIYTLGIIAHGETNVTVQCPDLSSETAYDFGIYAMQGTYETSVTAAGITVYNTSANAKSTDVWKGGTVPQAPSNVKAVQSDIAKTVSVTWDWTWDEADSAVISWSEHEDAWESTDEPSTYTISHLHAGRWNISGLDTGVTWHVRVRLTSGSGENTIYGPWSEAAKVDLSSAPETPSLILSESVITEDGNVTAYWAYTSGDGTSQAYAEVCEAQINAGGITYGKVIAHTLTSQAITINAKEAGWSAGNTYYLCVRVISASGRASAGWSAAAAVTVAQPLIAVITKTSLEEQTVQDDPDDPTITHKTLALTVLPLTLTVTGAGTGGTTIAVIERRYDYHMERPDGNEGGGFAGETCAISEVSGEGEITISADDLLIQLDDGASYTLIVTVKDSLGQSAAASENFEVHWAHQAEIPGGTAVPNKDSLITVITPAAPVSYAEGDVCDIYRLSADGPELIIYGGAYGTSYVDPYPAFGEGCGHRIVDRTVNGDYITADDLAAWVDIDEEAGDVLDIRSTVIDFDGGRVVLPYNLKLGNSWEKDFERTRYLGGSIAGDWNPGVFRNLSLQTDSIKTKDESVIRAMRQLASYSGICHVRTPDGSSFAADVEVSESREYNDPVISFSLDIKQVESESFDGMTLAQWNAAVAAEGTS